MEEEEARAREAVPASVSRLLTARQTARQREVVTRARLPVNDGEGVTVDVPALPDRPEGLDGLRSAFQQQYFELLLQPEVRQNVARFLRSKDAKVLRDLLQVLLPVLLPQQKSTGTGGTRVTVVSSIARPEVVVDAGAGADRGPAA